MTSGHGTSACYKKGCRREECRQAERGMQNERTRLIAYGRWQPWADPGPAREHLQMLARYGIGLTRAAGLAGLSDACVLAIVYGRHGRPVMRIRAETEKKILAVRPAAAVLPDGCVLVDAAGTRRRVQALAARGWSQGRLAVLLGVEESSFRDSVRRSRVRGATARAVAVLYEEIWNVPPPEGTSKERMAATTARRRAAARGWPPPAAWGEEIDDPAAPVPSGAIRLD